MIMQEKLFKEFSKLQAIIQKRYRQKRITSVSNSHIKYKMNLV